MRILIIKIIIMLIIIITEKNIRNSINIVNEKANDV